MPRFKTFAIAVALLAAFLMPDSLFSQQFKSVTEISGIPMFGITSVVEDNGGFIWGASRTGIIRATTHDCSFYYLPFHSAGVMKVRLASRGDLLAGVSQNGKVFRYNPVHDRFESWVDIPRRIIDRNWVSGITIAGDSSVWMGTTAGILRYDGKRLSRINLASQPEYAYIVPLCEDWLFAVSPSGFYHINMATAKATRLPGKFGRMVSGARFDRPSGKVWIGTHKGEIYSYDIFNCRFRKVAELSPGLIVRDIVATGPDALYAAMEGGGVLTVNPKTGETVARLTEDIEDPTTIKDNNVRAMLFDSRKRLWVSTTSGGLQFAETEHSGIRRIAHTVNDPLSLHNNNVNKIAFDSKGNMWIATNDGVSVRDRATGLHTRIYDGRQMSVLSVAIDSDDRVYASTYGNGVFVIDGTTRRELRHLTGEDSPVFGWGQFVFATFIDRDGQVWFGGNRESVTRFSPTTGEIKLYEPLSAFCFSQLPTGEILAGGGEGISVVGDPDGEKLLSNAVVNSMTMAGDTLWACTTEAGVVGFVAGTKERIRVSVDDDLRSDHARAAVPTPTGLWISTSRGISCYDAKEKTMRGFTAGELLTNSVFGAGAGCVTPDGEVAFGTAEGVVIFSPELITKREAEGRIFFSDIKTGGKSIRDNADSPLLCPVDSLKEVTLDYTDNSLTVNLMPLGDVSKRPGFSWKLDGIDENWCDISPVSYINYSNIPPGKHTLHVRLHDGGVLAERSIIVQVNPPFWQTWWFRLLAIATLAALVVFAMRQYAVQMRLRYATEKIEFLTRMADSMPTAQPLPAAQPEKQDVETVQADKKEVRKVIIAPDAKLSVEISPKSEGVAESCGGPSSDDSFLMKAVNCVTSNISNENFDKAEFASAMAMSPSLLYKRIKTLTGMPIVEFIRSIRLSRAKDLLMTRRYNVTEVSEMCGFTSAGYFSRVFRDHFGTAPTQLSAPKEEKAVGVEC